MGDEDYYINRCEELEALLLEQQVKIDALKAETTQSVMAEHCTCYKLGYNPLNNYATIKAK